MTSTNKQVVLYKPVKAISTVLVHISSECLTGVAATLLLANPVGQNALDFSGLLSEASKVFGLRGRRLKLYLDQDLSQGKMSGEYPYMFAEQRLTNAASFNVLFFFSHLYYLTSLCFRGACWFICKNSGHKNAVCESSSNHCWSISTGLGS